MYSATVSASLGIETGAGWHTLVVGCETTDRERNPPTEEVSEDGRAGPGHKRGVYRDG